MVQFFVCRLLQPLSIFDNIQSFLQVRNPIWNLVCELNSKTQSVSRGATYELGVSAKLLKRFSQQKVRKRKLSPRKGFCLDSWNLFRGDAASFQTCTSERLEDIFIFLPLIRNLLHWKLFRCGRIPGVNKFACVRGMFVNREDIDHRVDMFLPHPSIVLGSQKMGRITGQINKWEG